MKYKNGRKLKRERTCLDNEHHILKSINVKNQGAATLICRRINDRKVLKMVTLRGEAERVKKA